MGSFWNGIGTHLATRWAAVSFSALVYWVGGLLAWVLGHGGTQSLEPTADWLKQQPAVAQAVLVLSGLVGVAGTGLAVERLTRPCLTLLEGYWPNRPRRLLRARSKMVDRATAKRTAALNRMQELAGAVHTMTATPAQRDEYVRMDLTLRRIPGGPQVMPTRIGNVLRAGETRPIDKYGLDAVVVWPHLWLLLPDTARGELAAARKALDSSVSGCVWGLLFVAFTPLTPWALPVGLGFAVVAAKLWIPGRAENFADLVEACFDLYRSDLYGRLRWPLPMNPAAERSSGREITKYLLRGLGGPSPAFTDPAAAPPPPNSTPQA
ncbi:hypothetical protein O3Q52_21645 [Streptomyces sp. ActVer]|uniref:hypothetical protein n=1 Tax=Streptomyces sp. ActVer TaxID=3014558 RepID=UPI0022B526B5|nr:hypothetical protein [Streptomyces sp. ActVer]MCZ4510745.1 hypothetical protein [Streptomyces sp. ActVer]